LEESPLSTSHRQASSPIGTLLSLWGPVVDSANADEILAWPPDVFALCDRALEASEAYRFVVSPPAGVELTGAGGGMAAARLATQWWQWLDSIELVAPEPILGWWQVVWDAGRLGIEQLASGGEWEIIEALLALHTVADEACAGLGSATGATPGPGCSFRAAARELFAETGSLSRASPHALRVLPRCRASAGGISMRSLSRHVFVSGPQVDVDWHRTPSLPTDVRPPEAHANGVLLPWPLRVRASDFRSVRYALPHMDTSEIGFFTFQPAEGLDLTRVDGVLRAAIDEAGTVDFVILPESAITPADITPLEALLAQHGVWCLIAGVRELAGDGHLGANWVHVGVRQELVWRHAAQHKHHRWRLDGSQIDQYNIGGALMPSMHWWEAVSIPRRSLQVIDMGSMTLVPLVCEDLARLEPVSDLVRSIGASLVVALLLDGPQLGSRWTARYASVLADDPGSAVCTLTSYGMVRRCRPPGCHPSRVVAMWKDSSGKLTEIELEAGADAILIATNVTTGGSSTADGRRHVGSTSTLTLSGVQSLRSDEQAPRPGAQARSENSIDGRRLGLPPLDEHEVSKAASWAETLAEAAVAGPIFVDRVMVDATAPKWRTKLGLPAPSRLFERAIDQLRKELPDPATLENLLGAAARLRRSDEPIAAITGTLIETAVEQRLVAEVSARRLPPHTLRTLTADPVEKT
jgi:hypothetical protein